MNLLFIGTKLYITLRGVCIYKFKQGFGGIERHKNRSVTILTCPGLCPRIVTIIIQQFRDPHKNNQTMALESTGPVPNNPYF